MDKRFAVVLAAIAVLGAWTLRPQTAEQAREQARLVAMDRCHYKLATMFKPDADGHLDVGKACEKFLKLGGW